MANETNENIAPRDHRAVRITKLENIRTKNIDPYPARFGENRLSIKEIRDNFEDWKQVHSDKGEIVKSGKPVLCAGRIMAIRQHGKSQFMTIADGTGNFQLYFRKEIIEEKMPNQNAFELLRELDIGDFISVYGELFKTRTGEESLLVNSWKIITKTLLPLPEKWHGLTDPDTRLRQRYLDLLSNPEVKSSFIKRSIVAKTIRDYLESEGYIELETPALTPLYGGATARPFETYHNALDMKLYLRIATELYLKRLIVGGFERVYEMGKVFRNEGVDRDHNPEFTLLELYEAYADYNRMMELAEKLVVACACAIAEYSKKNEQNNNYIFAASDGAINLNYEGVIIRFQTPFIKISFVDAIKEKTNIDILSTTRDDIVSYFRSNKIDYDENESHWAMVDRLFKETVEPMLISPTFVVDYPVALSPLAKRKADNPALVERFELFIFGKEIGNAFSELNDPLDQRARMEEQLSMRAKGDPAAQIIDEDFLTALEHGMPPTGGMGIGVDRLATILAGAHGLKDVMPFPLVKPK